MLCKAPPMPSRSPPPYAGSCSQQARNPPCRSARGQHIEEAGSDEEQMPPQAAMTVTSEVGTSMPSLSYPSCRPPWRHVLSTGALSPPKGGGCSCPKWCHADDTSFPGLLVCLSSHPLRLSWISRNCLPNNLSNLNFSFRISF